MKGLLQVCITTLGRLLGLQSLDVVSHLLKVVRNPAFSLNILFRTTMNKYDQEWFCDINSLQDE